jgi:hypothetical protein
MNTLILIGLIALLLTYLESKKKLHNGMLMGFFLITVVVSLRFGYGNDYFGYLNHFQNNNTVNFKIEDLFNGVIRDPLWFLLNRLFGVLGFQWFVAALSIINSLAYYKLIKVSVPTKYWTFAFFVYFFSYSFFTMQLSMMRQALAMALIVFAVPLIIEKKIFAPSALLIATIGIHSSSIVCIPFMLLMYFDFSRNKKLVVISLVSLFLIFFFNKEIIKNIISSTITSSDILYKYQDKYVLGSKYEASGAFSLFGYLLFFIPVLINIIYVVSKNADEKVIKYTLLFIFGSFISLTNQIIPMLGRVAWFFTIFSIVSIPIAYNNIRNKYIRVSFILLFILVTIREYYVFFHLENWKDAFLEYRTIFNN